MRFYQELIDSKIDIYSFAKKMRFVKSLIPSLELNLMLTKPLRKFLKNMS